MSLNSFVNVLRYLVVVLVFFFFFGTRNEFFFFFFQELIPGMLMEQALLTSLAFMALIIQVVSFSIFLRLFRA